MICISTSTSAFVKLNLIEPLLPSQTRIVLGVQSVRSGCAHLKSGKLRILAYTASMSIDAARHVIIPTHADLTDWRNSQYLLAIVDSTQQRLKTFAMGMTNVIPHAGWAIVMGRTMSNRKRTA
jgi:hypothetical protein